GNATASRSRRQSAAAGSGQPVGLVLLRSNERLRLLGIGLAVRPATLWLGFLRGLAVRRREQQRVLQRFRQQVGCVLDVQLVAGEGRQADGSELTDQRRLHVVACDR